MEPFDSRSRQLVAALTPGRILDFGCGTPPRFILEILAEHPTIEALCVDAEPVDGADGIACLESSVFLEAARSQDLLPVDYARASFVFHEICDDLTRGEEIGGIHTPEGLTALTALFSCLAPGGLLDLIDVVTCEFDDYLRKTRPDILESTGPRKLADAVYLRCICKRPGPGDIQEVAEIAGRELGRDPSDTALVLHRLFVEYPPLRGPERAAEKDEFVRLLMHFRKYKDHHVRCPVEVYEDRLQQAGFTLRERWTPDQMRFQFVCAK